MNIPIGKSDGLDQILSKVDAKTVGAAPLIPAQSGAKPRQPFDSGLPFDETSFSRLRPRDIPRMATVFPPLLRGMFKSGEYYEERFQPSADEAPSSFFTELEALARRHGATDVGYVRDVVADVFKDHEVPEPNAVVYAIEMDEDELSNAPSFDAFREVASGYKLLGDIGRKLTEFMRDSGYSAYPGTSLGGLTDYVSLAERAGLGAIGYHGLLIAPQGGSRLRINTIYTNLTNLPERSNPHGWVRDFCSQCRNCVRSCPVGAIYDEPQDRGWNGKTSIEVNTCRDYFARAWGCAVCVKVCPFSNAGYEQIRDGFHTGEQSDGEPVSIDGRPDHG